METTMEDNDFLVILGYFVRTKKIPKIIKYLIISILTITIVLVTLFYNFGFDLIEQTVSSIFIVILGLFFIKIVHDN